MSASDDLGKPLTLLSIGLRRFESGTLCEPVLRSREPRLLGIGTGPTVLDEKDRDFGIMSEMVVGLLGEGLLLRLFVGLEPGVFSRECLKLELRVRQGSASNVGSPVAEVVVVQVLVDMRRIRLGGKLRRKR